MTPKDLFDFVMQIGQAVAALLVAGYYVGQWAGNQKGKRAVAASSQPPLMTPSTLGLNGNGTPSVGEVYRRVQDIEQSLRGYVHHDQFDEFKNANEREHDQLRAADRGLEYRFQKLMGEAT